MQMGCIKILCSVLTVFFKFFYCVYMCTSACHGACMEVPEQLLGVDSLLRETEFRCFCHCVGPLLASWFTDFRQLPILCAVWLIQPFLDYTGVLIQPFLESLGVESSGFQSSTAGASPTDPPSTISTVLLQKSKTTLKFKSVF